MIALQPDHGYDGYGRVERFFDSFDQLTAYLTLNGYRVVQTRADYTAPGVKYTDLETVHERYNARQHWLLTEPASLT